MGRVVLSYSSLRAEGHRGLFSGLVVLQVWQGTLPCAHWDLSGAGQGLQGHPH